MRGVPELAAHPSGTKHDTQYRRQPEHIGDRIAVGVLYQPLDFPEKLQQNPDECHRHGSFCGMPRSEMEFVADNAFDPRIVMSVISLEKAVSLFVAG